MLCGWNQIRFLWIGFESSACPLSHLPRVIVHEISTYLQDFQRFRTDAKFFDTQWDGFDFLCYVENDVS
jgi:hypothetical protein